MDWVAPEGEGFSEVGGVHVEVIRVVTDVMPSSDESKGWSFSSISYQLSC